MIGEAIRSARRSTSTDDRGADECVQSGARSKIGVLVLNTQQMMFAPQYLHITLTRLLDRSRFRPFVATPDDGEGRSEWEKALGADVWSVPLGTSITLKRGLISQAIASVKNLRLVPGLLSLARRARREQIRIIHTETKPRDMLGGLVLSLLTGADLVIHWHVVFWGWYPLVWHLAFRRASAIIAVSETCGRSLLPLGIPAEKIQVVHNGVDVERFRPELDGTQVRQELGILPEEFVVLLPGRLRPQKGGADLLRAVAMLKERGRDVTAVLVGADNPPDAPRNTGPFRPELERLQRELGIEHQVLIVDHRRDMPEVMAAADVVTVLSRNDAFGLVVTEAMACGRPVVGALSGGIPEILQDDVTGLMVPVEDPEALADAIERLMDDPVLRLRLGRAGRQDVVARFSEEQMVKGISQVYEMLAEGQPEHADSRIVSAG